jgi:hypothetical protein
MRESVVNTITKILPLLNQFAFTSLTYNTTSATKMLSFHHLNKTARLSARSRMVCNLQTPSLDRFKVVSAFQGSTTTSLLTPSFSNPRCSLLGTNTTSVLGHRTHSLQFRKFIWKCMILERERESLLILTHVFFHIVRHTKRRHDALF